MSRLPAPASIPRYRGGVAANAPSPAIRVVSVVPKLDSEAVLDSGVCEKNAHRAGCKDSARTPPRAPNFNVHIHAQAAVYKSGRLFGNGSHSPGSHAPNFEIGGRGVGQLQAAFEMGVFLENHGTPQRSAGDAHSGSARSSTHAEAVCLLVLS